MNLLDLAVRIGVDDQASSKMDGITSGMIAKATVVGNAFYDAAKFIGGKALDMGKAIVGGAVDGYASYEQLTGGMKKLYRDASDTMIGYAQNAYKDVGISANKYMEGVAGFSAAMMNSVGNDSQKAAALSNTAMKDIADNANTFGKYTVDELTEVYQALAKGQFQTLDNLNLGYGGSKAGMQQLIDKANELKVKNGESADLTIDKFSDMVEAIHLVQNDMRITGTTANEAMGTIEGSVNMAKASWTNFLTAIGAGDEGMIRSSISGMMESVFGAISDETGKREGGLIANVIPVLQHVADAVVSEFPNIANTLMTHMGAVLSDAFNNGDASWVAGFVSKFWEIRDKIGEVFDGIGEFVKGFFDAIDTDAVGNALQTLGDIAGDVWGFVESNILPNMPTFGELLGEAANFMIELGTAVLEAVDSLGPFVPMIAGAVGALMLLQPISGILGLVSGAFTVLTTIIMPAIGMVQSFGGAIALVTTLLGGPIPILVAIGGAIIAFIATNETARTTILNVWNAVVAFFNGIPAWWNSVWTSVGETVKNTVNAAVAKFEELRQKASDKFNEMKNAAVNKFNEIKSRVTEKVNSLKSSAVNAFENMRSSITNAFNNAKSAVVNAATSMYNGLKSKFDAAVSFVRGIPGRISGALSGLGGLLWGAGSSIISGLLDGMKSAASGLFSWVSSIAGTIASLKGPLDYDRKVLIPNGLALMDSLYSGIKKGFESEVVPYVSGMALNMGDVIGTTGFGSSNVGSPVPMSGVTITGNTFYVREESDIRRVSEELYDLINRGGGASWSTSFITA